MQSHVENIRVRVGNNLKLLRLENGLSQEALAEKTGLHRTYISSLERGQRNVSIDALERLAKALSVKVCEIVE